MDQLSGSKSKLSFGFVKRIGYLCNIIKEQRGRNSSILRIKNDAADNTDIGEKLGAPTLPPELSKKH